MSWKAVTRQKYHHSDGIQLLEDLYVIQQALGNCNSNEGHQVGL